MSKSLGNGEDPMDVIEKYGADSLRFFLTTNSAPGMDLRYDEEKVASTWNFINKLWNASRFVLMNLEDFKEEDIATNYSISEEWILTKMQNTILEVRKNMDKYEFHNVGNTLYNFIWEDFCDNYIEVSKANMNNTTKTVLLEVLTAILKMLHPFMPYVTEEIYSSLPIKEAKSIMISKYPEYEASKIFTKSASTFEKILEDIQNIRNLKAVNKITKDAYVSVEVDKKYQNIYFSELKIKEEQFGEYPELETRNYQSKYINITYYFEGEKEDLEKIREDIKNLEASILRREKLLSNENYVNKAPANIVELDRQKLKEEKEKLEALKTSLN